MSPDSRELYLRMLADGLSWQEVVRDRLIADGIPCKTDTKIYAHAPKDDGDLDVGGHWVEVKSLGASFTSPSDWPFREVFIDTVEAWDIKKRERLAIINISKPTGGMVVIPVGSSRPYWYVTRKYDKQREMEDDFYAVAPEHLRTYIAFLSYLRTLLDVGVVVPPREQLEAEKRERQRGLYVRERALLQNARDGYKMKKPYEEPHWYAALEREFGAEVPDEEWQTSIWRMR